MRNSVQGALALVLIAIPGLALPQSPDNPNRYETTRERDNPARAAEPPERNNPERIDPRLDAELQKCQELVGPEYDRCVVAAKRRFGEM
jgi:hypothetical protein